MPLPTFVVCGAQKAGTSTLHDMLGRHPEVFVSTPKELHFFDVGYRKGLEWYADRFRPGDGQRAWGETTPGYLYKTWARRRMCRDLPDARFLVILRDPVQRAYSHYWMNTSQGHETETFEQAVRLEPQRQAERSRQAAAKVAYLGRGRYVDQLEALAEASGRDCVDVTLMTDLLADPGRELARIFGFLGVDPAPAGDIRPSQRNSYRRGPLQVRRKASSYPPMDPATDAALREYFRDANDRLGAWLGRDLSSWNEPVSAPVG